MTRLRTRYTQRLPTAPGLRLAVPFFEGSGEIAHDLSGKDNHGTLHNVTWTSSEQGPVGSFNGSTSHSDHGNDPSLNITDAITIEAWVKPINLDSNVVIFCRGLSNVDGYYLYITNTGAIRFKTSQSGAFQESASGTGEIVINNLYYVVATRDGASGKLYKNGVDVTSLFATHLDPTTSNRTAKIGVYDSLIAYFNGTIDKGRIYNRALSAEAQKRRHEQPWYDYCRGG